MMRRSVALAVLVGAAVTACDYPTEPPRWDQTWVVPGETIDLSVAELLPAGVDINADTTAFLADVPETAVVFSLETLCGAACPVSGSYAVPVKPEFGDTVTAGITLPADVVSATLAGGTVDLVLAHDFNFDPLRPNPSDPAAETGSLGVTITSGGTVVADTVIRGETQSFGPGETLTPSLSLRPVTVANDLELEVSIYSPEGEATTVETTDTLGVTVLGSTVAITEATVTATSVTIDPTTTTLDFGGIEEDGPVLDNIQSGAIRFDILNPFTVTGSLEVVFDLPTGAIRRTLPIQAPADGAPYEAEIELSGDELRSILGAGEVDVIASGSVTAVDGTVTVRPDQELVLENEFELVLRVGGGEDG